MYFKTTTLKIALAFLLPWMLISGTFGQTTDAQALDTGNGSDLIPYQVFRPEVETNSHVIVLLPDLSGLDQPTLELAEQLSSLGYPVIVPDFEAALRGQRATNARLAQVPSTEINMMIEGLLASVASEKGESGKLVLMGTGWGATQAFELATRSRLPELLILFDGKGPKLAAYCSRITAPVYGFYGGLNSGIRGEIAHLNRYMLASNKIFVPVIYEEAEQGFILGDRNADSRINNQFARSKALEQVATILVNSQAPTAMR